MTACSLCALPIEDGRAVVNRSGDADRAFCCAGCLNVYAILAERGDVAAGADLRDTELFRRGLELGLVAAGSGTTSASDIPADAQTVEAIYQLSGLWCGSCAWLIAHALEHERGVVSADVSFAADLLRVRYAPQYVPPDRIIACVRRLGYGITPFTGHHGERERDDLLLRLGLAAFLWMNVMTFNAALYVGYFEEIPPAVHRLMPFLLMTLTAPAVFYSAWPILRLAALGLRAGMVRMETLLALGILSAFGYSVVETVRGGAHVYFDTACAIVTLVLIGKWIERLARDRTMNAMALLHRSLPQKARLVVYGRERYVAIDALAAGQQFVVRTGERIPADGTVVSGAGAADESLVTGESVPVTKAAGDAVVGGSLNVAGPLTIAATRVGSASTIAHMVGAVDRALATRSAVERTVDRVSRVFVPVVVAIALGTCVIGWLAGLPASDAVMRAIAVMVIACPCALGIATPLAMTAAVGAASRRGVLITDPGVLETIRRLDAVVLDKTGTVTTGAFSLLEVESDDDLRAVAAVETFSEHLLGRAIVQHAQTRGGTSPQATDIDVVKGSGISGVVEGRRVLVGNRSLVGPLTPDVERRAADAEARGCTVAFYRIGDGAAAPLVFGDRVKSDARDLVGGLRDAGVRVVLLSGDSPATTESIARQIGIGEVRAGAGPADKARHIRDLQAAGLVVAMVGDGANDGEALAQADLGIAMGSGTDLAMRAAAMVLMVDDLSRVTEAFDLARDTLRVVRQNLFWAFIYNVVGIGLAASGLLHPIVAAAGMVLSSLTVIGNSMRLARSASPGSPAALPFTRTATS